MLAMPVGAASQRAEFPRYGVSLKKGGINRPHCTVTRVVRSVETDTHQKWEFK
jgi:hypothetical protein